LLAKVAVDRGLEVDQRMKGAAVEKRWRVS
jgi:hypothetical protein